MKITHVIAATLLLAASPFAAAQDPDTSTPRTTTPTDRDAADMKHSRDGDLSSAEFVKKAGAAGQAEVAMGKLGAQKATDENVKEFAQKMVTDHGKGNQELKTAAQAKGVEVPDSPDAMHKAMHQKFEMQEADAEFDRDFMAQMVKDHKAAIELYQKASVDSGVDPQFQALAKKTLPHLREHLAEAQRIEQQLAKR